MPVLASAVSGFFCAVLGGAGVALEGGAGVEPVAVNALLTDVVGDGGGAGGEEEELVVEVSVDLLQACREVSVDLLQLVEEEEDLLQEWPHGRLVA